VKNRQKKQAQSKRVTGIVDDPVTLLWYMGWFVERVGWFGSGIFCGCVKKSPSAGSARTGVVLSSLTLSVRAEPVEAPVVGRFCSFARLLSLVMGRTYEKSGKCGTDR
jgi:uncharacterized membrane protein